MNDIKEVVEYIKSNVVVMDYAAKHYGFEFKDSGNNLVPASCKLRAHGNPDDTPSFMYQRDSNSFYCHGCKTGGTIFDLVGDMEGLETRGQDFIEIVKIICRNEGIEFNFDNQKPVNPEIQLEIKRRTELAIKYRQQLWDSKDSQGFQYLIARGLTEKTIKNFSLGITSSNESKYGLANISNRIAIPILNTTGKQVLAFSYRTLDENAERKYINNGTDEVFHKGEIFYGWSHAIEMIRKTKHCYVVEGYFDMISMYQIGLKNTVAMMTSQMTEEQIALLAKTVKNITLVVDQDQAGMNGFNRTIVLMLKYGLNVKIVSSLSYAGKDMNDVCVKYQWDLAKVKAILDRNSKDAVMFKLDEALSIFDEKMMNMVNDVLVISNTLIDNIQDPSRQEVIKSYVNKRLGLR